MTRTAPASGNLRGYLAVLGAATLWGISGVVAKTLFNRRIEPWTVVEIRLTGAFLVLLLVLWLRRHPLRVAREHLVPLGVLGVVMLSTQFLYYFTISVTDVSTAIFLQYTAPAFVALYGRLAEREALSGLKSGAIAVAVAGSYLLVTGGGGMRVRPLGLATGFASAVMFGVYAVLGRSRVHRVGSVTALLYALGAASLVWSVIVPPWKAFAGHAPQEWALFGYIVVFATIMPFWLFLTGLRTITSSMASLTATFEPVVASAAAFAILGERLSPLQALGGAAIAAAVVLIQVADIRTEARGILPPAPD
ncbi:MAG: DMT family transporter [Armatimonadota bacterium]|nr:DMT family transporter [Armatimonadota bacterium]MDR7452304.1 DMT family transporter [Armatimonadota bacterium]MDR7467805.1 DMT family transporter [Armatimonadota bacterium]MDR7494609.1 DMT family transporter [Armatimonadota bacterium]MDR7499669.1 DMT family transporter [Armatimonadota bacterium]